MPGNDVPRLLQIFKDGRSGPIKLTNSILELIFITKHFVQVSLKGTHGVLQVLGRKETKFLLGRRR